MATCVPILKYKGGKAEAIRSMINDKLLAELESSLPERAKNKELLSAKAEYDRLNKLRDAADKKLDAIKKRLKLDWKSNWVNGRNVGYKWEIDRYQCVVPKWVFDKLQEAQRLTDIGKRKEANEIYNELIKKYNLV